MALPLFQFVAMAAIIVVAGTYLTRLADRLAEVTGIGRSLAGLLLLAAATSLPELTVDCSAALIPAVDIAVGDLLGSSLYNLLILGIVDLLHRSPRRMLSSLSAAHALSATTSIVLTAIALLFILLPVNISLLGVGPGSLAVAATYLLSIRLIFIDQQKAAIAEAAAIEAVEAEVPTPTGLRPLVLGYLATTAVIFVAGRYLAISADELAKVSGLGGTFVGTTMVALSTSLPEMVTTFTAARMGAFEMAVGNILGSNCFNMAILLPVDIFYRQGSLLYAVNKAHAVTAAAVIIITGVAMQGLLYRVEKKYWLVEPDAALVVVLVVAALATLYYLGQI